VSEEVYRILKQRNARNDSVMRSVAEVVVSSKHTTLRGIRNSLKVRKGDTFL
jgi:hypothetical protein